MEKIIILFLISSMSSCNGDLGRLSGLLLGAGQQIHNKVHGVADAVLGGLNVHGHLGHHDSRPPVQQQPNREEETIIVIVEETNEGNQGQGQPQRPYGMPQQGQYRPPNGYANNGHHNHGHNPNNGFPNQDYNNHRPTPPVNYGQGPYHGQNNENHYGNGINYEQNQYTPSYPNQGQHNNQNGQGYNQNGQANNNVYNGNVNPTQNYENPNNNVINNNPNTNANEVKNPEQKPNLNDNYKPTETYNGQQHNQGHQGNTHQETNDKTTKKPEDDGPLFVPLNDYTYGGDKITINAPKRETDKATTEESEVDFPIDIRFKDE